MRKKSKENIIEIKNLNKTFIKKYKSKGIKGFFKPETKEFKAVNNINLEIKKGEIVAFVGPNGAGKSTTIKMLTGILHPSSGEIKVAGLDPVKQRKILAYKIGCMFGQKSGLWMHLPAIDSYKLYGAMYDIKPDELDKRINEVVEMFNLKEIINIPVRKLSLGQRMICEIAGIMLHKPEILFLDEPTIGLDIVVKDKVRNAILKINKEEDTTIFLTSHDLGDIEKLCKRIIIIDNGQIIKDEDIEILKKDYLKERYITIIYENEIKEQEFDYPIAGIDYNKIFIKVDTNIHTVSEILEKFMKYGNVIDIEAIPVPLEDVIFDIYTKGD